MATEVIGVLGVDIDLTQINRMNRALGQTEQNINEVQEQLTELSRTQRQVSRAGQQAFRQLASATQAATIAATALTAAFALSTQRLTELQNIASRLDIGATQLQGLQFAAQQTGANVDVLNDSLTEMSLRISEAREGAGEARDPLLRLGVDLQQIFKLNPEQQFLVIADALKEVENTSERIFLIDSLFGGSGVELINLLTKTTEEIKSLTDQGNELSRIGGFDPNAFNESSIAIQEATTAVQGLADEFLSYLAPVVTTAASQFAQSISEIENVSNAGKAAADILSAAFTGLGAALSVLKSNFDLVATAIAAFVAFRLTTTIVTITTSLIAFTRAVIAARGALLALNVALATNPLTLFATVVAGAAGSFMLYKLNADEAKESLVDFSEELTQGQAAAEQMTLAEAQTALLNTKNQTQDLEAELTRLQERLLELQSQPAPDQNAFTYLIPERGNIDRINQVEDSIVKTQTALQRATQFAELYQNQINNLTPAANEPITTIPVKNIRDLITETERLQENLEFIQEAEFVGATLLENQQEKLELINKARELGLSLSDGISADEQILITLLAEEIELNRKINEEVNKQAEAERRQIEIQRIQAELDRTRLSELQKQASQLSQLDFTPDLTLDDDPIARLQEQQRQEQAILLQGYEAKRQLKEQEIQDEADKLKKIAELQFANDPAAQQQAISQIETQAAQQQADAITQINKEQKNNQAIQDQNFANERVAIEKQQNTDLLNASADLFGGLADLAQQGNEKAFRIAKALRIAEATINGYTAVSNVLADASIQPTSLRILTATAMGVRTAAQIASIKAQTFAKGGIVNGETVVGTTGNKIAIAGEAGPEAILPMVKSQGELQVMAQMANQQASLPVTRNHRGQLTVDARKLAFHRNGGIINRYQNGGVITASPVAMAQRAGNTNNININVSGSQSPDETAQLTRIEVERAMENVSRREIRQQQRIGGSLNPLAIQNVF